MATATRDAFGTTLAQLGAENGDIVVLDADVSKSTKSSTFAKAFPDRFYNLGITEANLVGTGAGLALCGKVPFISSFACFLTGRYDQIRVAIGYANANVKIVGTHVGIGIGEDGYSQMGLEDLGVMRSLPNMVIIQPGDGLETELAIRYAAEYEGPMYFRLTRQKLEDVNRSNYRFRFGKGVVLRDGADITIIASGGPLHNSLLAAEELAAEGIDARVVNIHTIKPIDEELIADCAKTTGLIVTVEDHNVIGGLGSAVCEAVAEKYPVPVRRIGMRTYGESGDPDALYEKYGLAAAPIAAAVRDFYRSKRGQETVEMDLKRA